MINITPRDGKIRTSSRLRGQSSHTDAKPRPFTFQRFPPEIRIKIYPLILCVGDIAEVNATNFLTAVREDHILHREALEDYCTNPVKLTIDNLATYECKIDNDDIERVQVLDISLA
jgi:hypothetical protein